MYSSLGGSQHNIISFNSTIKSKANIFKGFAKACAITIQTDASNSFSANSISKPSQTDHSFLSANGIRFHKVKSICQNWSILWIYCFLDMQYFSFSDLVSCPSVVKPCLLSFVNLITSALSSPILLIL